MAEYVTVRNEFGEERRVTKTAAPFFVNQGYVVLTSDGRKNTAATTAASTSKEN